MQATRSEARDAVGHLQRERARRFFTGVSRAQQAGFRDRVASRIQAVLVINEDHRRAVVGTVDSDGQHRRRLATVTVGDFVGVGIRQRLPGQQCVDHWIRIVQRIGVAAVRAKHQVTVGKVQIGRRDWRGIAIRARLVVVQHIAADRARQSVFRDAGCVRNRHGYAVRDGDVQAVRCRMAFCVRSHQRQMVHDLAHMDTVHLMVQHVGVIGVRHLTRGRVVATEHHRAVRAHQRDGRRAQRV